MLQVHSFASSVLQRLSIKAGENCVLLLEGIVATGALDGQGVLLNGVVRKTHFLIPSIPVTVCVDHGMMARHQCTACEPHPFFPHHDHLTYLSQSGQ